MSQHTDHAPTARTKRPLAGYVITAIVALVVGAGAVAVPAVMTAQAQAEQLAAAEASLATAEADLETANDSAAEGRLAYARSLCEQTAARQTPGGVQIQWRDNLSWPAETDGEWLLTSTGTVFDETGEASHQADIECHLAEDEGDLAVNAFAAWGQ